MEKKQSTFINGSSWLKADFHLHTKADKEFKYTEEPNDFIKKYIECLKSSNISIGVITNHNKFDLDEFKALRRKANKENIYLLPGVELSVNDGSNGIHCLIAFEYESWIVNGDNFIEQFLNSAFEGIANHENENTTCNYSLTDLFDKLELHRKNGRDSFITMAHIEQRSGFCSELNGGRITTILNDELFKRNVLAFQKLRTNDIKQKLRTWFNGNQSLPALVEGSDCKKLSEIGHCGTQKNENGDVIEKETWLKIGDFNFEAIKYALTDSVNRVSYRYLRNNNSFIKSISFEGGLLDGTRIGFSPELNNFIGIRGSGKSSILEILRYTLGISLSGQAADPGYKNHLIEHVLKSGGKVIATLIDRHNKIFRIEKIYGQRTDIYEEGNRLDVPSVETIFGTPVYFGQKDLSNQNIDFEADLVRKLIGNKLDAIKSQIENKSRDIQEIVHSIKQLTNLNELKKEIEANIADAQFKLKIFKEKGIEDKLKQQGRFDTDIARFQSILTELTTFQYDLSTLCRNYQSFFTDSKFITKENTDIFQQADSIFKEIVIEFEKLTSTNSTVAHKVQKLNELFENLKDKKETLKEEFAKIKREIDIPNVNPDDYLKFNKIIDTSRIKLSEITKSEQRKAELTKLLNNNLAELNSLWHEEFKILEQEVSRINQYENSLSISVAYKGRRDMFRDKIQEIFKGSGMRNTTYEAIIEEYPDFIEIYKDYKNIRSKLKVSDKIIAEFKERLLNNLGNLLTFRVQDKFTINYNGKPLKNHSLGQRATALILFLLAQKETDVLIIDQPEDDLDNQTIYEQVIKQLKALKGEMQFIFATHNANIPVLGDSEKIIACEYSESKIEITDGTIDCHKMQQHIVQIMEGGEEAFNRRKNIYSIWNLNKQN
ncbi:histidinol-phosphatase [Puteibacter caeruleilacunae]|nr:histidinol-phosphatase [Puteibacter caeruleilacunae]